MSYDTLVADKSAAGSILNWVGNSKVDTSTVLDEAQALIYASLRVQAMEFQWVFGVTVGQSKVKLPNRYLDPIGKLTDNVGGRYLHPTAEDVRVARMFDNSLSGSFGNNPFTTTSIRSGIVTAVLVGHGLNQGSDITIAGATAVDGVTINGTSLITSVTDANTFQFYVLDAEATTGAVTGGGAAATYTANNLIASCPQRWSVWENYLQFDAAFSMALQFRLMCYRSLPLLSTNNKTNFLTDRYPHLMREACLASAASYRQDDSEYAKHTTAMMKIIQSIQAEDDLKYRGADLYTRTP